MYEKIPEIVEQTKLKIEALLDKQNKKEKLSDPLSPFSTKQFPTLF